MKEGWYFFNEDVFVGFNPKDARGNNYPDQFDPPVICIAIIGEKFVIFASDGRKGWNEIARAESYDKLPLCGIIRAQMLLIG